MKPTIFLDIGLHKTWIFYQHRRKLDTFWHIVLYCYLRKEVESKDKLIRMSSLMGLHNTVQDISIHKMQFKYKQKFPQDNIWRRDFWMEVRENWLGIYQHMIECSFIHRLERGILEHKIELN